MMVALLVVLFALFLFLGTASLYISVMRLRDMKAAGVLSQLHWSVTATGYALLYIGLIFDFLLNIFVMSFVFLEPPHEALVTARVRRHKFNSTGWRQIVALWFCANFLTPFDGNHCG